MYTKTKQNLPDIPPSGGQLWLKPAGIFEGDSIRRDLALHFSGDGKYSIVNDQEAPQGNVVQTTEKIACAGFFDLQVNGGGGAMFNSNPTPSGIKMISKAHRKTGTTSFLPTVITDTPEVVRSAAFVVLETHGKFGVRGIHIEGPHINPERKGTHNQDLIRKIDQDTLDLLEMLRSRELPVLLTLAPEMVPAGMIASMVKMGVVVSAGHTNATANQIEQALAEGVSMFTHLFNGMSQMTGREPGAVGAALASDAWCGIIADGHHVDMRMVNLAFATGDKGAKIFIV